MRLREGLTPACRHVRAARPQERAAASHTYPAALHPLGALGAPGPGPGGWAGPPGSGRLYLGVLGALSPSTPPPGFQPAPCLRAAHGWQASCPAQRGTSSRLSSCPGSPGLPLPGPPLRWLSFHPALSKHPASLQGAALASGHDLEFWGCSPTAPSHVHIPLQSPHVLGHSESSRQPSSAGPPGL